MGTDIRQQAYAAAHELCECAGLKAGQIMVIGCSTSEVVGSRIGTNSDVDVALELFLGIKKALDEKGVYLAAQCCEHLNRAIISATAEIQIQVIDGEIGREFSDEIGLNLFKF